MKYAVDKIDENIVTLENITTGEKRDILLEALPASIKEGSIVLEKDNQYIMDILEEELRRKRISEKLERLKNLNTEE